MDFVYFIQEKKIISSATLSFFTLFTKRKEKKKIQRKLKRKGKEQKDKQNSKEKKMISIFLHYSQNKKDTNKTQKEKKVLSFATLSFFTLFS